MSLSISGELVLGNRWGGKATGNLRHIEITFSSSSSSSSSTAAAATDSPRTISSTHQERRGKYVPGICTGTYQKNHNVLVVLRAHSFAGPWGVAFLKINIFPTRTQTSEVTTSPGTLARTRLSLPVSED